MAKEELTRSDLVSYEDSVHEIAYRLRKLREKMENNGDEMVKANVGTLRYHVGGADKYSRALVEEYERFSSQKALREKLKGGD